MMTKLPRWVEAGGFALAAVAGTANAVGLLGFRHQAVSHVTGTSTFLAVAAVDGDGAALGHLLLVLLSFVLGAVGGGAVVGDEQLRVSRRYATALLLEAALLLAAAAALAGGADAGHLLASAACGLQNALVSTYSGAVVRTTHVSGLLTDLGAMLGHRLRGRPLDRRRAVLYLLLVAGFVAGGAAGAVAFRRAQFAALLLPAGGAAAQAAVCGRYAARPPGD